MYVASAAYADRAGTADTAANALKLGGYDASDYLRKDEVQTVTAAYQEIEWTTPGTYNWVVPEGVNSILVTTVGGGGGYGYFRHIGKDGTKYYIFPAGAGGEVIVNQLVRTTPGETLQIVVGKAGSNITTAGGGNFNDSDVINLSGRDGGHGGMSYIMRNNQIITTTKARGGAGGLGKWIYRGYSCYYSSSGKCDIWNHWYHTYQARNTDTITTKYSAAIYYYGVNWGTHTPGCDTQSGDRGYSGEGGKNYVAAISGHYTNYSYYWRSGGTYVNPGGGGSWGDGGGLENVAGIGGGGAHYSYHGIRTPGNGRVGILAIGVTYDE